MAENESALNEQKDETDGLMYLPENVTTVLELYDSYEHMPDRQLIQRAIREKCASETIYSAARFEISQQQMLRKLAQCSSDLERRKLKVSLEEKIMQFVDIVKRRLANFLNQAQHYLKMMITKGRDQGAEMELDTITRELNAMCINCIQKQAQVKLSGAVFDMQPLSTWVEQRLDSFSELDLGDLCALSRESVRQAAERLVARHRQVLAQLESLVHAQQQLKNPYAPALHALQTLEQSYCGVLTRIESGKTLAVVLETFSLMRTQFVLRTLSAETIRQTCERTKASILRESDSLAAEASRIAQQLRHFGTPLALTTAIEVGELAAEERALQERAICLENMEDLLALQDAQRLKNNGRRIVDVAKSIPSFIPYPEEVEIQLRATRQRYMLQHLRGQAYYEHEVQVLNQRALLYADEAHKRYLQEQLRELTQQYNQKKRTALQNHVSRVLLDFDLQESGARDENIRLECERLLSETAVLFFSAFQKVSIVQPSGYAFEFESYAAFADALLEQIPEHQLGDLSQLQRSQLSLAIDKVRQQFLYVSERLSLVESSQKALGSPYAGGFKALQELEKSLSALLGKVSDTKALHFLVLGIGNMRAEVGLKTLTEETLQETLQFTQKKIETESRQLIAQMKSTALRLKAFGTPKAHRIKQIVRGFQRDEIDMIQIARSAQTCETILGLLETRKERNMITTIKQIQDAIPDCVPLPPAEAELELADSVRMGLEALQQRIVFEHEQQIILRQMLTAPNDLDRKRHASALQEQQDQYTTSIQETSAFWISQAQFDFAQLNIRDNPRGFTEEREASMKQMASILNELLAQVMQVVRQGAASVAQTGYTFEIQPYSVFAIRALQESGVKDPGDIRLINKEQVPLMVDRLIQQHEGLLRALKRLADEQFHLANPYLADIQSLTTLETKYAACLQQIEDHQILHFTTTLFNRMRTQISIKTFSNKTIKETIDQTRTKIISESQQLIESVQSAVCQLKKYNTKHAKLLFNQFDQLIHDERQNQDTAMSLSDCNQLFKLLDTYKRGVSKEVFNNLADRVVYVMKK